MELLTFILVILVTGVISFPFSAMLSRKKDIFAFAIPLVLWLIALIVFVSGILDQSELSFPIMAFGLLIGVGALGSTIASIILVFIRK